MKKYKLIITLPGGYEIDSSYEMDGAQFWPTYSQADPITLKGVWDSPEKAQEASQDVEIFEYTIYPNRSKEEAWGSYYMSEDGGYFFSPLDASEAAYDYLSGPGSHNSITLYADEYEIEEIESQTNSSPQYQYTFFMRGEPVTDSYEIDWGKFDSYEEAEEAAQAFESESSEGKYEMEVEICEGCDFDITPIDIEKIEVVECDEE